MDLCFFVIVVVAFLCLSKKLLFFSFFFFFFCFVFGVIPLGNVESHVLMVRGTVPDLSLCYIIVSILQL